MDLGGQYVDLTHQKLMLRSTLLTYSVVIKITRKCSGTY